MWSFGITCLAIIFSFFSTILALLGSHTHIVVTCVLVVGVYVYARGPKPFIHDIRMAARRIGVPYHPQGTPAVRSLPDPKDDDFEEVTNLELPPTRYVR